MSKIRCSAKINWFLNVENLMSDGYHQLQTFMQRVDLYDTIHLKSIDDDIIELIDYDNKCGCLPKHNIIVKTTRKLKKIFNVKSGISISIEKNIPVCAGLGGGSSNAAAVLKALISLWSINVSDKDLNKIAASIGADVPFFLDTNAGICEGIGEKIVNVKAETYHLVLWNPRVQLSTISVYKQFDKKKRERREISKFIKAYSSGDLSEIAKEIWNNLAFASEELFPELKEMKNTCIDNGAITSWISGSGPTVVSLCANISASKDLAAKLREKNNTDFICECVTE
ncbi:4-(cytidine 5'-diphospho)-2-C-methyl-D-erythritol kinase [bacterium]|nr:4-(cytidine 5'-diphospho)-2-C-methyl-D-erythritol kinase [bacterium]